MPSAPIERVIKMPVIILMIKTGNWVKKVENIVVRVNEEIILDGDESLDDRRRIRGNDSGNEEEMILRERRGVK